MVQSGVVGTPGMNPAICPLSAHYLEVPKPRSEALTIML